MRFTVSTTTLQKNLQLISGAIGGNRTFPISECFIFDIKNGNLSVTASDGETSMSVALDVMADDDGNVGMPAKMLLDILKNLPDQPLTFKVDTDNYAIEILAQSGKYKLGGEDATDFLDIANLSNTETFHINASVLSNAINKTLFAVATDELRPAMTGVFFRADDTGLTFVSTDAHKLVRYQHDNNPDNVETEFILPKKALTLLKNVLPSNDSLVNIAYNRTGVLFSIGNARLVCRLIDARFPDYKNVIPLDNPNRLTINRSDFANSLKRLSIFANKNNHQVVFEVSDNELKLSTQDLDYSNEAAERLTCQYTGDDMQIAFNARFLSETLSVLDTEEITLEMSTPNRAGIILPTEQEEGSHILMLMMPLMLFS
jgi:DNA polymerase-3 subunit beta